MKESEQKHPQLRMAERTPRKRLAEERTITREDYPLTNWATVLEHLGGRFAAWDVVHVIEGNLIEPWHFDLKPGDHIASFYEDCELNVRYAEILEPDEEAFRVWYEEAWGCPKPKENPWDNFKTKKEVTYMDVRQRLHPRVHEYAQHGDEIVTNESHMEFWRMHVRLTPLEWTAIEAAEFPASTNGFMDVVRNAQRAEIQAKPKPKTNGKRVAVPIRLPVPA